MNLLMKVAGAYKDGGIRNVAKAAYLRARPGLSRLPRQPVLHAGIKVGTRIVTDNVFAIDPDIPLYEHALLKGLNAQVRPGDRVVVIGCGKGVTATVAATLAGAEGHVTGYEGALAQVDCTRATLAANGTCNATIHHAIVASPIGVYGDRTAYGEIVPPAALPECDVLEMDCEGSEIEILQKMTIRPRAVLVETHGIFGASTDSVAALLTGLGYAVTDLGWAEPYLLRECTQNDIRVLQGVRPAP